MRKLALLFLIFFQAYSLAFAQPIKLSEAAEISVITCSPGNEALYAAFGHSAIRVRDPKLNMDLAYNYGIFDFDQPNFYLNFAKGYLNYKLGVRRFDRFIYAYQYYNRSVYEQVLDLDSAQRQQLYSFLATNALPENQYYFYDYFYNNCATKVWDAMETEFPEEVIFDDNYVETGYSFRDLVNIYTVDQPWGDFGIDLCLGLPMDKTLSPKEFMFLPDYIFKGFEKSKIIRDGEQIPLVKTSRTVFESNPNVPAPERSIFTPNVVFWSLFILILAITLYSAIFKKRRLKVLDIFIFSLFGLLGLFLFALWVFTDHAAASNNLNILWANPLYLVAVGGLLFSRNTRWVKRSFRYNFYFLVLLLLFWYFIPQGYNPAFFPIVMILAIRSWYVSDRLNVIS